MAKAEGINQVLHHGAINKNYRARVMAALLLALIEDTPLNIDAPPSILIDEIKERFLAYQVTMGFQRGAKMSGIELDYH